MNEITESTSNQVPSVTLDSDDIYVSPTVSRLPSDQRQKLSTVCVTCPAAIWHALPKEMRCYCRAMHVLVWTEQEKNALTACDGREMAIEQMLAQQEQAQG